MELELDARYVTLAALLQSVPQEQREGIQVYRVKPDDKTEPGGKTTYVRRRHLAILNTGFALCTCAMERHVGIPCRHFFAVLRMMANGTYGFNIAQVNLHWHLPHELSRSQERDWIYLSRTQTSHNPTHLYFKYVNATGGEYSQHLRPTAIASRNTVAFGVGTS